MSFNVAAIVVAWLISGTTIALILGLAVRSRNRRAPDDDLTAVVDAVREDDPR